MKRGLSAWAHFPIFLWIVGPIIVWPLARDEETKLQVKQALLWQITWTVVIVGLWGLAVIVREVSQLVSLSVKVLAYFIAVIVLAYSIYAAYKCFEGEGFRYPLISHLLPEGP